MKETERYFVCLFYSFIYLCFNWFLHRYHKSKHYSLTADQIQSYLIFLCKQFSNCISGEINILELLDLLLNMATEMTFAANVSPLILCLMNFSFSNLKKGVNTILKEISNLVHFKICSNIKLKKKKKQGSDLYLTK